MRIAFFGLPLAACLLLRDGHDLVYAATSRPGPGLRRVKRALGDRLEEKPDVTSKRVIDRVRASKPDRIVSWFWTTRLPAELLAIAPGFGVHPSLLPRHRGPDPFFHAIDQGDRVTGVTAHRLAPEYDTGAILAQRELAIDPAWNAWQLARALDRPSLALLRAIAKRDPLPRETPQDDSRATLAPAPSDEELEIDWTWDAERIVRRVRAAAPWPGAWAFFGDEAVTITRAEVTRDFPRALEAGEAAVVRDGSGASRANHLCAIVRAGDLAVRIVEGRMESADEDSPHELDAADWVELVSALAAS